MFKKIVSVSASIATAYFLQYWKTVHTQSSNLPLFDSRVFVIPREEAVNYFYWRQRDAVRNSISALAQSNFSHKQLQNKNMKRMKEMLNIKGVPWDNCETWQKRGWCVKFSDTVLEADLDIPDFSEDREYIGQYLVQLEE